MALYKSRCACGEVEIDLKGEPAFALICYCQDCTTSCCFVDSKAQEAGSANISNCKDRENDRGAYNAVWLPCNITFAKGKDKMCAFKKPDCKNTRTYTSCCKTSLIVVGGKESFPKLRIFNANTLVHAATGQPFRPTPVGRVQTKNAPKEHVEAAPQDGVKQYKGVPPALIPKVLPIVFGGLLGLKGTPAHNKGDTTNGLYNNSADVTELLAEKDYRAAGHSSGWPTSG